VTHKPKKTEKKLPEALKEICATWDHEEIKHAPIKLIFQDEARFGRISDVRRCWAPLPLRPVCQAMITRECTYAYGAVDVATGELDWLILPKVNTHCMQIFLDELAQRHLKNRIEKNSFTTKFLIRWIPWKISYSWACWSLRKIGNESNLSLDGHG
jgi:hypothetical protein